MMDFSTFSGCCFFLSFHLAHVTKCISSALITSPFISAGWFNTIFGYERYHCHMVQLYKAASHDSRDIRNCAKLQKNRNKIAHQNHNSNNSNINSLRNNRRAKQAIPLQAYYRIACTLDRIRIQRNKLPSVQQGDIQTRHSHILQDCLNGSYFYKTEYFSVSVVQAAFVCVIPMRIPIYTHFECVSRQKLSFVQMRKKNCCGCMCAHYTHICSYSVVFPSAVSFIRSFLFHSLLLAFVARTYSPIQT